jgi:peptidoglycan/xylan/chitin deacetylase (PgdA/CDA1 family)
VMMPNLLSKGAAWVPLQWARPLSGVSLVVPFYHMVSDAHVPHVSNLYRFRTVAEFKSDVEFLVRHFEPVTLTDIVDALNGTRTFHRQCFHLTFDDGFREMHDIVAPILQRFGVPATFFLNTAFLDGGGLAHHNALSLLLESFESRHVSQAILCQAESLLSPTNVCPNFRSRILSIRHDQKFLASALAKILEVDFDQYVHATQPYLSSQQIAMLLAKGFSIGAHSHDHPLYADLPLPKQLEQTRMSMDLIRTRFAVNTKAFAFPYNDDGVPRSFFSAVFDEPFLDVSFGTSGLVPHFHPRNIQRVSFEKSDTRRRPIPVAQILARQFVRATYFRLLAH